jgi:hypothetical protein
MMMSLCWGEQSGRAAGRTADQHRSSTGPSCLYSAFCWLWPCAFVSYSRTCQATRRGSSSASVSSSEADLPLWTNSVVPAADGENVGGRREGERRDRVGRRRDEVGVLRLLRAEDERHCVQTGLESRLLQEIGGPRSDDASGQERRNESRERERRARGAVGVGKEGRDGAAKTISNAAWPLALAPTVISSRKPLRAMKYVTFEPSLASGR